MEVNTLVNLYQSGRYSDAEELAISITKRTPGNQFSWKILAAILLQRGKASEALIASKKSVILSPKDTEAKYNLGVVQQQLGQFEDAIDSYKKAIELKPGYIEAYTNLAILQQKLGRFQDAEISYKKVIQLEPNLAEPYFNLGNTLQALNKLEEAEASYNQAIILKPNYHEAICNLGVVYQALGRLEEAVDNYRYSISLNASQAATLSNLGNALKELGRLEEAEDCYRQAVILEPNYAEAFYNLGITLQELERLEESEVNYQQAINIKNDYVEAYCNLGVVQQELKKIDKAEESYKKAISLNPNYAQAHCNLGLFFKKTGRLEEAEESFKKSIYINSKNPITLWNFITLLHFINKFDDLKFYCKHLMSIDKDNYGLKSGVILALTHFLEDDVKMCEKHLLLSSKIKIQTKLNFKNEKTYHTYLSSLLKGHEKRFFNFKQNKKNLYVIGESHSLVSHRLNINNSKGNFFCKAKLIMGCKQFHLGNSVANKYQIKFKNIMCSLPQSSEVLISVGEIDCRIDTGIMEHLKKYPTKNKRSVIISTIKNYLNYVYKTNRICTHNITIQGIPCPNIDISKVTVQELKDLIELIKQFNYILKYNSKKLGFNFLDLHTLTNRGDGFSNNVWHLDSNHLSYKGMLEAWRLHLSIV